MVSNFIYSTCHYGAEKALIEETLAAYQGFTPGFSKKGFVTFKSKKALETSFKFSGTYVEAWGFTLEQFKNTSPESLDWITAVKQHVDDETIVHIWARYQTHERSDDIHNEPLRDTVERARKMVVNKSKNPKKIIDVIWIEENECVLGLNFNAHERLGIGNRYTIDLPEKAPSRAYLKIAEAFERMKPQLKSQLKPNTTIMELGSAPGGASYYLLERGFKVIGIDAAEMSTVCLQHPKFKHIKKSIAQLTRTDISNEIEWIVMDINVKASEALSFLKKVLDFRISKLKGVLLTLKINHTEMYSELPKYLKKLKSFGFKKIESKQLYNNKQEVLVTAEL